MFKREKVVVAFYMCLDLEFGKRISAWCY